MMQPTIEQIHAVMRNHGMKVFTSPFDCTLGWIRTKDNKSNAMNDWLFMSHYLHGGGVASIVAPGTSDAGLYFRENPMHIDGTAIIQHGKQYRGAFQYKERGAHRGQEGFRQVKPLDYWRDADRDQYLDFINPQENKIFNTNGHDMGSRLDKVDKCSAGCWGSIEEIMDIFYSMAQQQIEHGFGDHFSLAALHEDMFLNA